MPRFVSTMLFSVLLPLFAAGIMKPANAALLTGVNIVNPMRAAPPARIALIAQLQAAGVRIVRCGITPDAQGIAFARALQAAGIHIDLIVSPQYPPGAPSRAYQPQQFPGMWGGHPLSSADPNLSARYFQNLLGQLDANGVTLAALELGNEINWAGFNPEFPLPGEGKVFDLNGLYHDPEGQLIARGYLQYLKILAVLKQVRDASRLNRATPIISAGLSPAGPARTEAAGAREDAVTIKATLEFLRANGLDGLVDAYGIHIYPWQKTAVARATAVDQQDVSACRSETAGGGKPCWVTEWGFNSSGTACPADDAAQAALVQETMDEFRVLNAQHRLIGVLYFSWDSDPWAKQPNRSQIYRCGALTEAGQLAITP